jgi:pimeloyl-ACP methyl ester carboxylesterase
VGADIAEVVFTRLRAAAALAGLLTLLLASTQAAARPFQAQVRFARADGTRIAYYERGAGPPLVMLTGTGSTMAEWDPALLALLARHHRLILFDYPGIGLSGRWRGKTFDSLADYTAAFMRAVGLHRADVLGWSMGGFVAQRLAIRHPQVVSHLILAATNPGGDAAVLGTAKAQALDSEPDPPARDILEELYPPNHQAEGWAFLHRLDTASDTGEIPDDFDDPPDTTRVQVAAEDPWLRSNLNYRQLPRVRVPTLVVGGLADQVVPPVNVRRIAARIPGAILLIFPGAHAFLFGNRAAFTRSVDYFLGSTIRA